MPREYLDVKRHAATTSCESSVQSFLFKQWRQSLLPNACFEREGGNAFQTQTLLLVDEFGRA